MFVVRCLLVDCCSVVCVVWCSLFLDWCLVVGVCCLVVGGCRLLSVVRWLVVGVWCLLICMW